MSLWEAQEFSRVFLNHMKVVNFMTMKRLQYQLSSSNLDLIQKHLVCGGLDFLVNRVLKVYDFSHLLLHRVN